MDRTSKIAILLTAALVSSSLLFSGAARASNKYMQLKGERMATSEKSSGQETTPKSADEVALEEHLIKFNDEAYDWRKYQSEFGIFGGDYLGDEWYNNWDVGARYYFNINKTFGFGVEYQYNPIRYDRSGDFGRGLVTDQSHTIFGAMTVANTAAFKSGNSIIDCDLYLTLGGGSIQINRLWEYMIMIGGGIKVYMPMRWMAVRFDVNSYMHPTPKPGGDAFNADLAINAGVSFFVQPNRKRHKEAEAVSAPDQSD